MINDAILYPVDHVPAIAYVPLRDPYGREKGTPLFRSSTSKKHKIYESDSAKVKAAKTIQNSMVTVRDYNMMTSLMGVGMLSRHQLQRLFWAPDVDPNGINKRLRLLVERDILISTLSYLDMLEGLGLERCNLYGLAVVGQEIVTIRQGMQSSRDVAYNAKYYDLLAENRLIRHHLMTSEIFTRLKAKSDRAGNEMAWFNEMACIIRDREHDERELVRPDGYALIWREGGEDKAYLFIETDTRNTEWKKKIESYEMAYARGNWQAVLDSDWFPIVLCVVPTPQAVKRVGALIKKRANNVTYLLKAWPEFLAKDPYVGWHHVQGDADEEVVKILPDEMIQEIGW